MSRRRIRKSAGLVLASALLACTELLSSPVSAGDNLARNFTAPPEETRPGVYWYWIDNQISKEGLTKDLEAMKQVGIGRAYIGIISPDVSRADCRSTVTPLTESWWDYLRHAIREAGRVGVEIGIFNSPGWSQSGGPWVKPEQSMRYLASTEIRVKGPQKFSGQLPSVPGSIRDIAVLAFPAPPLAEQTVPESSRTPTAVTFESADLVTVRSVTIKPVKAFDAAVDFQVSDDGVNYRNVKRFWPSRGSLDVKVGFIPLAPVIAAIPPTKGRHFRLQFSKESEVGEIRVSSALRQESAYDKQLAKMCPAPIPAPNFYTWPPQPKADEEGLAVPEKSVRNLTEFLSLDGSLTWEVPPGEWVITRMSEVSTGVKNDPAPPEGTGLEVDKMSREHLKAHFDAYVGKLYESMPAADRKALKYVIADSYEKGSQNWTDDFEVIFRNRYGYDPRSWLPVLSGWVVETPEKSDRFLWDFRRLIADRIATEYVGGLRALSHKKGLSIWLENYGHWGFPAEFLQYGGQSDEVAGEFWVHEGGLGDAELRCAASAAHIYGKKAVWAESYTGGPSFLNTPRDLKKKGDWSFSEGVNQPLLHVYIHQATEKYGPGINAPWGTEFNRHNTWWNYAMKPWVDYQRRCTVMLQAGCPVADVAYFIGEDAPKMTAAREPELPSGYDYDFINAEVIVKFLTVKNGRFVLPNGTSYRVLVLPQNTTMRPAVLKKIGELVAAGGVVLGPMPKSSPSLENYPACDQEVEELAKAVWGSGKIRADKALTSVFADLKCGPDVIVPPGIVWKHRTEGSREIYFIANQEDRERDEKIRFRVSNKEPELWWPETGKIEPAASFKLLGEQVEVLLHLGPLTSVFVVFSNPATGDREAIQKPAEEAQPVLGPWQVRFGNKTFPFEKLVSWPEHGDPKLKYYSGAATYTTTFEAIPGRHYAKLDLGIVNAIAQIRVNGRDLGILWKGPYEVDLGNAVKPGKNTLEVTIVDSWINRIVGDKQPGATPVAFVTFPRMAHAGIPLKHSGLLGPVQLMSTSSANLKIDVRKGGKAKESTAILRIHSITTNSNYRVKLV